MKKFKSITVLRKKKVYLINHKLCIIPEKKKEGKWNLSEGGKLRPNYAWEGSYKRWEGFQMLVYFYNSSAMAEA